MHRTDDSWDGRVLVTGATGTVGREVVRLLDEAGVPVTATSRRPGPGQVELDLARRETWTAALAGADRVFVLRPPDVTDVTKDLLPFLAAARDAGVRHAVLLSVQGADRLTVVPHARIERWLRGSGTAWTFLRPSFFVQNLTGVHAPDVVAGRLVLPAGRGRTAFVDAHDVAAVAAAVLADPTPHAGRAWTPTGPQALTYDEVADVLTDVLGRRVRYDRSGLPRFALHARRTLGLPWGMVAVTSAIYTTARLGLAAGLTDDVRTVTGRAPATLRDVAVRERAAWEVRQDGAVEGGVR